MKKLIFLMLFLFVAIALHAQVNYVLESRYRNPIDTTLFHRSPTVLLFVHSKCNTGHLCATMRMQAALESDSLGIRKKRKIKLYVIYPKGFSEKDIAFFDSLFPQDASVAFYTDEKYKGVFSEGTTTPAIIIYDGKGNRYIKIGGSYESLCELMKEILP